MTKSIWFVNHYSYPNNLYPHQRTNNYAKLFHSEGYNVRVFCASYVHRTKINLIPSSPSLLEIDDVIPYSIIRTTSYTGNGILRIVSLFQFYFGFLKHARRYPTPDLIIATTVHPLAPLASIRYAKNKGIKVVTETADLWPETLIQFSKLSRNHVFSRLLFRLERHIYQRSDQLIFTMEGFNDYFKWRDYPTSFSEKSHYLNNSMSCSELKGNSDVVTLEGDLNKVRLLYFGALGEANAVDKICSFIESMSHQHPDQLEFHIFGHGELKFMIEDLIQSKMLKHVYLYPSVAKNRLYSLKDQVDFVFMFVQDLDLYNVGYSMNKLMDYFCFEKPIIHNFIGPYDIVTNRGVGFKYSFSDMELNKYFHSRISSKDIKRNQSFQPDAYSLIRDEFMIENQYNKLKLFLDL